MADIFVINTWGVKYTVTTSVWLLRFSLSTTALPPKCVAERKLRAGIKVIYHQAVLSYPRSHCSTFQSLFSSTKRTIGVWRLHLFTGINREAVLTKLVSAVVFLRVV